MTAEYNPHYLEYCRYHGLTVEQMLDKIGKGTGRIPFSIWFSKQVKECYKQGNDFIIPILIWGTTTNDVKILDMTKFTEWLITNNHKFLMEHCL